MKFLKKSTHVALLLLSVVGLASTLRGEDMPYGEHGAILLAQDNEAASGSRQRIINKEAKSRSKTKVDFDKADISGARKTPVGNLLQQRGSDKDYDFVKLRLRWHPEMIQSTSSLNSVSK